MCRLLAYLGSPVTLDSLLLQPPHSLMVQSYQPREMTSGLLNADGFGLGWYAATCQPQDSGPFIYRNILPIWNDPNLVELSRYIVSGCVLANVRSATPGQGVQLSNCQPFRFGKLLGIHNGFIENFADSLQRPLRETLQPEFQRLIQGTTDSEYLFALFWQQYRDHPTWSLAQVLTETLQLVSKLALAFDVRAGLNLIVCDGQQIIACRYAYPSGAPSLYWLQSSAHPNGSPSYPAVRPGGVWVASEPIWPELPWQSCAEATVLTLKPNLEPQIYPLRAPC